MYVEERETWVDVRQGYICVRQVLAGAVLMWSFATLLTPSFAALGMSYITYVPYDMCYITYVPYDFLPPLLHSLCTTLPMYYTIYVPYY